MKCRPHARPRLRGVYCPLREGVVRCVIKAGVQEHCQGSQGGDDDKQPQEETVHHQGDELPVPCHLQQTETPTQHFRCREHGVSESGAHRVVRVLLLQLLRHVGHGGDGRLQVGREDQAEAVGVREPLEVNRALTSGTRRQEERPFQAKIQMCNS